MLQQILQQQQQILQQQQETRAQLDNLRRRAFNSRAYDSRKDDAPLRALRKEADREAGGAAAAAAAGSLPEEGVFPATYGAALAVGAGQKALFAAHSERSFGQVLVEWAVLLGWTVLKPRCPHQAGQVFLPATHHVPHTHIHFAAHKISHYPCTAVLGWAGQAEYFFGTPASLHFTLLLRPWRTFCAPRPLCLL